MRARPGQVFSDLSLQHTGDRDSEYRTSEEYRATTEKVSHALHEAIHAGGGTH